MKDVELKETFIPIYNDMVKNVNHYADTIVFR